MYLCMYIYVYMHGCIYIYAYIAHVFMYVQYMYKSTKIGMMVCVGSMLVFAML